jgi:hypothetical protein
MMYDLDRTGIHGNRVVRLVLVNALLGAVLGLAFALALLMLNSQGLGRLLLGSDAGLLAFALLASGFMVTFGSVAAGTAVMQIGRDDRRAGPRGDGGPGPRGRFARNLAPIPVRVRASSQDRQAPF